MRIGEGSELDGDMELIESFIRYKRDPTNKNNSASIFEYYTSRLRSYWAKCKENLEELNCENIEIVRRKMHRFEDRFFTTLENMIEKFYKDYVLRNDEVLRLATYISNINCCRINPEFMGTIPKQIKTINNKTKGEYEIFLLFNDTGYFHINSYLQSLFNKILILGIPSDYQVQYDNVESCPVFFIIHDILHFHSIILVDGFFNDIGKLKDRYNNIISNKILSREYKECVSIGIFLALHELDISVSDMINYDKFAAAIEEKFVKTDEFHDIAANLYMYTRPIYKALRSDFEKIAYYSNSTLDDNSSRKALFVLLTCNEIIN